MPEGYVRALFDGYAPGFDKALTEGLNYRAPELLFDVVQAAHARARMPAFGAFTGGLNIRDAMFADAFGTLAFKAHLLGDGRLYAFAAKRCLPD